jgi:hypothetical protein
MYCEEQESAGAESVSEGSAYDLGNRWSCSKGEHTRRTVVSGMGLMRRW